MQQILNSQQLLTSLSWKRPQCYASVDCNGKLKKWLLCQDSFTKRVMAWCSREETLSIEVLREGLELAKSSSLEFRCFDCRYIYMREINIYLGDDLLMYARSVMPQNVSTIFKRLFRSLAQKPLGQLLFACKEINRSPFEIAKILPTSPAFDLASDQHDAQYPFLWGRRSLFFTKEPLVLLTEVFSPNLVRRIYELG